MSVPLENILLIAVKKARKTARRELLRKRPIALLEALVTQPPLRAMKGVAVCAYCFGEADSLDESLSTKTATHHAVACPFRAAQEFIAQRNAGSSKKALKLRDKNLITWKKNQERLNRESRRALQMLTSSTLNQKDGLSPERNHHV